MEFCENDKPSEKYTSTSPSDYYAVKIGQECLWALEGRKITKNRVNVYEVPYTFGDADSAIRDYLSLTPDAVYDYHYSTLKITEGRAEYSDYFDLYMHGKATRDTIVAMNEGLIRSVGLKFGLHPYDDEDLLQEGRIALTRAVELFNPGLGLQFSTYAVNAIKSRFNRYIPRMRYAASIEPVAYVEYRNSNNTPTSAKGRNIPAIIAMFSFDHEDENRDHHERFGWHPDPTAEEAFRQVALDEFKMRLSARDSMIVNLLEYGYTQAEIAQRMGVVNATISMRWTKICQLAAEVGVELD